MTRSPLGTASSTGWFAGLGSGGVLKGFSLLSRLASAVVLARAAGAEGYGTLVLGMAVAGLVALVAGAQVGVQAARTGDPDFVARLPPVAWALGVLAAGATLGIAQLFGGLPPELRLAVALWALLSPPMVLVQGLATARLAPHRAAFLANLEGFARLAMTLGAVLVLGLDTAAALIWVEPALGVAVLLLAWRLGLPTLPRGPRPDVATWRRVGKGAAGLLPAALGGLVLSRLDVMMVGALLTTADVAQYQVAVRLGDVPFELYVGALVLAVPTMARLGTPELGGYFNSTTRLLTVVLVPVVAAVAIFGDVIATRLFGASLAGSVGLYAAVSGGIYLQVITGPNGALLIARSRGKALGTLAAGLVGADVVLNLLLIPPLGVLGAAVATTASYALVNVAFAVVVRRETAGRAYGAAWARTVVVATVSSLSAAGVARVALDGPGPAAIGVAVAVLLAVVAIGLHEGRRVLRDVERAPTAEAQ